VRPLPDGPHRTPLNITSRQHPLLKELRDLRDKPNDQLLFLEGPKLIEEALKASIPLKTLLIASSFTDKAGITERAKARSKSVFSIADSIFESVSDLVEPQGILAIGEKPRWTWEQLLVKKPAPIVVLEGLQNPGNVSAILRTAEAAGAAGVITTPSTARFNSPKALRGAMGSALRVASLEHQDPQEVRSQLSSAGYTLYAADQTGKDVLLYTKVDWTRPCAIILGQEGGGISGEWDAQTITIPMESPVESLNVAAAAAVLLYEAYRQRKDA
jgi:RNA methyltransferase, TrmH family